MKTKTLVMLIVLLPLGIAVFSPTRNTLAHGEGLAGRTITGTVYFISGRRPGLSLPFRLVINRITTEDFGTFPARLMGLQVRGRGSVG